MTEPHEHELELITDSADFTEGGEGTVQEVAFYKCTLEGCSYEEAYE